MQIYFKMLKRDLSRVPENSWERRCSFPQTFKEKKFSGGEGQTPTCVSFLCQKGLPRWPKKKGGGGPAKTKCHPQCTERRRLQGAAVGELGSAAGWKPECVAFGFPLLAQPWPQPVWWENVPPERYPWWLRSGTFCSYHVFGLRGRSKCTPNSLK